MPMELLRALAHRSLPCTFTEEGDIDRVRVLRAAGYVAALLSPPGAKNQTGRVLAITEAGRKALHAQAPDATEAPAFYPSPKNPPSEGRLHERG